jgi:hypothetical protein
MEIPSSWVTCDGCGFPSSPAHIGDRVGRLEFATRFRPIHINVLFVAAAPLGRPEDDFYRPPESREFFDPFMDAVGIPASGSKTDARANTPESDTARLAEFQRRGYYLAYLSECPISTDGDSVSSAISRLGSRFILRVRFNYKPRHIAILGANLSPLRKLVEEAAMSSILILLTPLEMLGAADAVSGARFGAQFRAALASLAPQDNFASEYDRIQGTPPK